MTSSAQDRPQPATSPFAALAAASARGRPAQTPAQTPSSGPSNSTEVAVAQSAAPVQAAPVQAEQVSAQTNAVVVQQPLQTVHILTGTGDTRFDAILVGCMGKLDERRCFQIDSDYSRLSHLFTLAQGSSLPANAVGTNLMPVVTQEAGQEVQTGHDDVVARSTEQTLEFTLSASAAQALKVNCIANSARGWGAMYESVARTINLGSIGNTMLRTEQAQVERNVQTYLEGAQLQKWLVPVIYTQTVPQEDPQLRARTESGLLEQAGRVMQMMPDVTQQPRPAANAQTVLQAQDAPIPQAWANHVGALDLTIEGELETMANTAQDAAQVAAALSALGRHAPTFAAHMRPKGNAIQAAVLVMPEGMQMDDDADDDEQDHQRLRGY